jgi:DNA replication and repair protein RecF
VALLSLEVDELRCLQRAELELHPHVNLIVGANGSGKTTLLEAAYLLGRGRSFRTRHTQRLIRHDAQRLQVLGHFVDSAVGSIGVGCDRQNGLEVRIDRQAPRSLAELSEAFPVQILDPGIHRLVEDGPVERRRWLDWGVFHVEPGFVDRWVDYSRNLKQRNAALKQQLDPTPWDPELARLGEELAEARARVVAAIQPFWRETLAGLLGESVDMSYFRGWSQGVALMESLTRHLASDRERGTTTLGPHRFDVTLRLGGKLARDVLSRGQQKLVGAALSLAMAKLVGSGEHRAPTLLLDDPAAELDAPHTQALIREIQRQKGQLIVTALGLAESHFGQPDRAFHVEQGRVTRL